MRNIYLLIAIIFLQMGASGQDQFPSALERHFSAYQQQAPTEKIFVHTDKEVYLPGEIIWFKLYDVDGSSHTPSIMSRVAYVDLLDKDGMPLSQAQILLKEGKGSGSFRVPPSASSGNFVLRAYTSWMKNFPPDYFFHKAITIINPLKRPDWAALEKPVLFHFTMYPEGGNLVEGLASRIAFHLVDAYGNGVDCRGVVLNEKRDTITAFNSENFGMGSFQLTPEKGHRYKVYCQLPDRQFIEQFIPEVQETGFVMSVREKDNDHLQVSVASNTGAGTVYLFLHAGKNIRGAWLEPLRSGGASWTIPIEKLDDGISHFTLFDAARQPVCERLYFKRPRKQMQIELKPDRLQYNTRSKISLDMIARYDTAGQTAANFSLAVVMVDSLRQLTTENIDEYLWLRSELKGRIESSAFYFSDRPDAKIAADNLMLTQGWRRFSWENVLSDAKPSFEYLPDYEGAIAYGKITDKVNGRPIEGAKAYLSVPGIRWKLSQAASDANGRVAFVLDDVYGLNEMLAQVDRQKDSNARIEMLHSFSDKTASFEIPQFRLRETDAQILSFHSVNAQVQTAYARERQDLYAVPEKMDSSSFYGRPDQRYFLDDYTRFRTMEEVIREYIARMHLKKEGNVYAVELDNIPYKSRFQSSPLVLVDGVPFFDFNKVMSADPLKVKKIEVVGRTYYLGHLVNSGIVSLSTYDGDLSGFELDPRAIVMEYEGLQLKRQFFSPAYDDDPSIKSPVPDNRDLLYWDPDINTSKDGTARASFYTSDLEGNFAIIVQGISETGLAGSNIIFVQVRR